MPFCAHEINMEITVVTPAIRTDVCEAFSTTRHAYRCHDGEGGTEGHLTTNQGVHDGRFGRDLE